MLGGLKALVCIAEEIFDVVDDSDVEGAARAASDLFAELEVFLRYLK